MKFSKYSKLWIALFVAVSALGVIAISYIAANANVAPADSSADTIPDISFTKAENIENPIPLALQLGNVENSSRMLDMIFDKQTNQYIAVYQTYTLGFKVKVLNIATSPDLIAWSTPRIVTQYNFSEFGYTNIEFARIVYKNNQYSLYLIPSSAKDPEQPYLPRKLFVATSRDLIDWQMNKDPLLSAAIYLGLQNIFVQGDVTRLFLSEINTKEESEKALEIGYSISIYETNDNLKFNKVDQVSGYSRSNVKEKRLDVISFYQGKYLGFFFTDELKPTLYATSSDLRTWGKFNELPKLENWPYMIKDNKGNLYIKEESGEITVYGTALIRSDKGLNGSPAIVGKLFTTTTSTPDEASTPSCGLLDHDSNGIIDVADFLNLSKYYGKKCK